MNANQAIQEVEKMQPQQGLQRIEADAPPATTMLAIIARAAADPAVDVNKMERLMAMQERLLARDAEKAFISAFVAMQTELKQVKATKAVHAKDGTVKFMVAPPEEIDAQARPIYQKHGFAVSYIEGAQIQGKVTKICVLQHIEGHKREHPYTVRIGGGPPGATESQADGSAHSYAKRGALCDALNIVISHQDLDSHNEGGTITKDQAEELERRVAETNSNKSSFLKLAGAPTFAEIASLKYDMLDQLLARKEGRA